MLVKTIQKLKLWLFAIMAMLYVPLNAQTTIQVGSGTGTTAYFPIYCYYTNNYSQGIYWASELTSGGATGASFVSKVRFYYAASGGTVANWNSWTVYLGNTTTSDFASTSSWIPVSSLQQVYSGTITVPSVGNWLEITLPTPFYWDGTSNLVVAVHENVAGYGGSGNVWGGYAAAPATSGNYRGIMYYSDPTDPNPASPPTANITSPTNNLAQVQFEMTAATACTGTPTGGTVSASATNVCLGGSANLSLSGSTMATGLTFQWESTTNLSGTWTPEGASSSAPNSATVTPPAAGTYYYRCAVTCGTATAYSDTVSVNVPTPFAGGTYTINDASPTGGSNFNSFADAIAATGCGIAGNIVFDVVAGSGPYNESIQMGDLNNASLGYTVTFNGHGATVQDTINSTYTGILMLNGTKYVKFDSLTFKSLSTSYGFGAMLYNGCDYDSITNCTFDLTGVVTTSSSNCGGLRITTTPSSTSSSASGATNTYIANNSFLGTTSTGGPYYGFYCYGPNTGNIYHGNTMSNYYYYGIYDYYGDSITYSNNTLTRETKASGSGTLGYYGYYFNYLTGASVVDGNKAQYLGGSTSNGSYCYPFNVMSSAGSSTTPIVISNNLITHMTSSPYYGMRISGGSYNNVYHNTINIDEAVSYTNNNYGIYNTSGTSVIENNLITITAGGTGTKYGLYYSSSPTTSDYNDVYINSTQSGTQNFGYSGGAQSTLSAWQTATSKDANSHDYDPQYLNAAIGDYTPTNAVLDNLGTYVGVNSDINGNVRSTSTPDIGAYEFAVPGCSGTPVAGTIYGVDSICMSTPFTLLDSGFTIAANMTYDWQYDDGSGWLSTGSSGISYTASSGILIPTSYRLVATCNNSGLSDTSNVIAITIKSWLNCYCTPISTCTNEGIQNVTFDSLNNSSNKCTNASGYEDFTGLGSQTTVTQGAQIPISVTAWINSNPAGAGVWIDYDHNGIFDTTEFTLVGTTTSFSGTAMAYVFSGTVTIDIGAQTGVTRMRVRSANSTSATQISKYTACLQSNAYGEYEDYMITIAPASSCSGTPNHVTVASSSSAVCPSEVFNLTSSNASTGLGLSYEWQYDNGSGFQTLLDTSGSPVTILSYTVLNGITVSTQFRMITLCSVSSSTDTSNVISVSVNSFMSCYCTPTGTSGTSYGVNNFATTGGYTNISNLNSGVSTGGYGDFSSTMSVSASIGSSIGITASGVNSGNTYGWAVWVDWNKDGDFADAGETVYNSTGYISSIPANTSFTVPALDGNSNPVDTGSRKMRIVANYLNSNPSNDYCTSTNASYAEWEDYMFNITTPPACLPPSALNATSVTGTSADLNWTENNSATTWEVIYGPAPLSAATADTFYTTSNPYSIASGLSPVTAYAFTVRSICNPGFDTSLAATGSFTTTCLPVTSLPWSEGFEGLTTLGNSYFPSCWYKENGDWLSTSATTYNTAHGGTKYIADRWSATNEYMWTPGISLTAGTSYDFSFFVQGDGYTSWVVDVFQNTAQNSTGATQLGTSYSPTGPGSTSIQSYVQKTYTFIPATTGVYYFAVRVNESTGSPWYLAFDDFKVEITPLCPTPTSLSASNVTATSADISWTTTGGSEILEYGPSGYTPGTGATAGTGGTLISPAVSPITLTLSPLSSYDVYLRQDCSGAGNGYSPNATVTVNTPGIPPANDTCGGATVLVLNAPAIVDTNTYATNDVLPVSCGSTAGTAHGLWYTFTAPYTGNFTFSGCDAPMDNYAHIFTGTSCSALTTCVGYDDDACPSSASPLTTFAGTSGTTYYILVGNYSTSTSTGTVPVQVLTPLAIKMDKISAINVGASNRVEWNTLSEEKGDEFFLQRSVNGQDFETIYTKAANGSASRYTYMDNMPLQGMNYYRLRMKEANGSVSYSEIVKAYVKGGNFAVQAYPNPVSDELTVSVSGVQGNDAQVQVTDITGKVVKTVKMSGSQVRINMHGLANGIYLIKYADNNHTETLRISKQ